MNNDIQNTNVTPNAIPPFMVDDQFLSDDDLAVNLADIRSFERPLTTEKPVTLWIALIVVAFMAMIFGAGLVWVPNFITLKAFHSLALGTAAMTCVALAVIHVLGARIRQI